jgi:hypothetical protein
MLDHGVGVECRCGWRLSFDHTAIKRGGKITPDTVRLNPPAVE